MLDDIAKYLGISKSTVSRAISGKGPVAEETKKRILEYTAEIGYFPNAAARNLATTKTRNIAFAMPHDRYSETLAFFIDCYFGVKKMAEESAYDVIIVDDALEPINRIISSRKADGVILTRDNLCHAALEKLASSGIPIVLTSSIGSPAVIKVGYDEKSAYKNLTSHLIDLWQGRIGLIVSSEDDKASRHRANGFMEAFAEKNQRDPHIIWDVTNAEDVDRALRKMHANNIKNIICGDDTICISAMNIIRYGRKINTNFNIASFHNSHYLESFYPEIPVVKLDARKLGETAGKVLINKIDGIPTQDLVLLDY